VIRRIAHRYFTEHPDSVGETYLQHCRMALGFSLRMLVAGFACGVHGFVPGLCRSFGSDHVERLHREMVVERRRST